MSMKTRIHLPLLILLCCLAPAHYAQEAVPTPEPQALEVASTPAQITISAVTGEVETRRVLLTANGAVKGLKVVSVDLSRSDDQAVIPATAITAQLPGNQIKVNDTLVVPFTFDLRNAGSGEFKGEALVQFEGGKINLPMTVKVKDRWIPPLLVLTLGIMISLVVTYYREKGKPRDEVLVRAGKVRAQVVADPEMDPSFRARLDALLIEANSWLNAEQWEEAQKSIQAAEAVIDRWRKGREDWRTQFKYRDQLIEKLKEFGEPEQLPAYLLSVRRGIEDAGRTAPDQEGPDKLRDQLDALMQKINLFTQMKNQLDRLNSMVDQLETQQSEWKSKCSKFERRMKDLAAEDSAAYQTLWNEIETEMGEVEKAIASQETKESFSKGSFGFFGEELTLLDLMSPPPAARPFEIEAAEKAANYLTWFKIATYALTVIFLAGAGFIELYMTKPAFGANRWSDYLALLVWGFGAEATRASIAELMKNWGVK